MDVLANMLITIKNGGNAGKEVVAIPFSKFKNAVAKALLDAGYIAGYEKQSREKGGDILSVRLAYVSAREPRIHDVKRISKPSRRLYADMKNMYNVQHGRGSLFVSTPKGIMTGDAARKEHVGGELLFEIW